MSDKDASIPNDNKDAAPPEGGSKSKNNNDNRKDGDEDNAVVATAAAVADTPAEDTAVIEKFSSKEKETQGESSSFGKEESKRGHQSKAKKNSSDGEDTVPSPPAVENATVAKEGATATAAATSPAPPLEAIKADPKSSSSNKDLPPSENEQEKTSSNQESKKYRRTIMTHPYPPEILEKRLAILANIEKSKNNPESSTSKTRSDSPKVKASSQGRERQETLSKKQKQVLKEKSKATKEDDSSSTTTTTAKSDSKTMAASVLKMRKEQADAVSKPKKPPSMAADEPVNVLDEDGKPPPKTKQQRQEQPTGASATKKAAAEPTKDDTPDIEVTETKDLPATSAKESSSATTAKKAADAPAPPSNLAQIVVPPHKSNNHPELSETSLDKPEPTAKVAAAAAVENAWSSTSASAETAAEEKVGSRQQQHLPTTTSNPNSYQDANMRSLLESIGRFQKTRAPTNRPYKRKYDEGEATPPVVTAPVVPTPSIPPRPVAPLAHKKKQSSEMNKKPSVGAKAVPEEAVDSFISVEQAAAPKVHTGSEGKAQSFGTTKKRDRKKLRTKATGKGTATTTTESKGIHSKVSSPSGEASVANITITIAPPQMQEAYPPKAGTAAKARTTTAGVTTKQYTIESTYADAEIPVETTALTTSTKAKAAVEAGRKRSKSGSTKQSENDRGGRRETTKPRAKRRKTDVDTANIQRQWEAQPQRRSVLPPPGALLNTSVIVDASIMAQVAAQLPPASPTGSENDETPEPATDIAPFAARPQGIDKEYLVVNSTDVVCQALMDGPWPGCLSTDMSVVMAALTQFATDIILPALYAEDPRSVVNDDIPIILGTMLMLREVLILNAYSIFGFDDEEETGENQGKASGGDTTGVDSNADSQTQQFAISTLATSVIMSAITRLEGYSIGNIPKKFLQLVDFYESGQGDVANFLADNVEASSGTRPTEARWPNGESMQDEDLETWLASQRWHAQSHPSVLARQYGPGFREGEANAVHISVVGKH